MSLLFSKPRTVYEASSIGSSSTSLLISKEEKCPYTSSGKDYSAAYGNLTSQYGASAHTPTFNMGLPQSKSQPQNSQKTRAKGFGAHENKYGAVGHGSTTSVI
ncbi:unnamed protein product [Rhizoctonia solani]|uniref:Uncharacterized protein n=1 Tax=Rhizoctonia solani TaxID=456999 RepID=A0A8H3A9A2_9AGAM|nr:unnamed protein product [Rhizoctonia solani]